MVLKSLSRHLVDVSKDGTFYVYHRLTAEDELILKKIGYREDNSYFLPYPINKSLKENFEGKVTIDRTQKEPYEVYYSHYINAYGNPNNRVLVSYTVERERFKRIHSEPFESLLCVREVDGIRYLTSEELVNSEEEKEKDLNVLNMFHSLFKWDWTASAGIIFPKQVIKDVPFEILPPGTDALSVVETQFPLTEKWQKHLIKQNDEFIQKYHPTEIFRGQVKMLGYFAYVFSQRGIVVLEKLKNYYGNATYVIRIDDWQTITQKDKAEVRSDSHFLGKVIHDFYWKKKVNDIFKKYPEK